MKKLQIGLTICLVLGLLLSSGCNTKEANTTTEPVAAEEVHLLVAGSWTDCVALEEVIRPFEEKYPNVHVEYEYLQDYYEMLEKRLAGDSNKIDLFFTTNIQDNSPLLPYALDLLAQDKKVDISNTFDGLIENFTYFGGEKDAPAQIYAIPVGAELRGMFVNKTLLASFGLEVPKNRSEFVHAMEVLAENELVPLQGNPGLFGQQFLFPYIANIIANADDPQKVHDQVNNAEAGSSELFREPLSFLYKIVENNWYNYKYVEKEFNRFTDTSNEAMTRDFLNIQSTGDSYAKVDDKGVVPFMNAPLSLLGVADKTKSDYHSEIEYEFMLAPVAEEGGYAYLSPAHGIGVNKNSDHLDYALEFINFFFNPEINKNFSEVFNTIPNTKDAMDFVKERYDIPANQVSQLGQLTFGYSFYSMIVGTITDISKANNQKYMQDDGNGNFSMYPFEYYMEALEAKFTEQRNTIE